MSADGHDGGGGHGGTWIGTYCDMITLLIACFIMIITFASKEKDKMSKHNGSIAEGPGGKGVAGQAHKGDERDSLFWRVPPPNRVTTEGSEVAPLYGDVPLEQTADLLRRLEADRSRTLADSYQLQIPLRLLFTPRGDLSPRGTQLLQAIGRTLRPLPFDLHCQVDDARHLPRAIDLAFSFAQKEGVHPGRLGVGVCGSAEPWKESVWFTFARRPL